MPTGQSETPQSQDCGRPIRKGQKQDGEMAVCRNRVAMVCCRCLEPMCWQHRRNPCPRAGRTILGQKPHMSREHRNALRKATAARIRRLSTRRVPEAETPAWYIAVVVVSDVPVSDAVPNGKCEDHLTLGKIENTQAGWEPDEDLREWMEANATGPVPRIWTSVPAARDGIKKILDGRNSSRAQARG